MPQLRIIHRRFAIVALLALVSLSGCERSRVTSPATTPATSDVAEWIYAIEASDSALIASTTAGIVRSTDQGASWAKVSPWFVVDLIDAGAVLFAPTPETIGVLRSRDHGLTWQPVAGGLPPGFPARRIVVDGEKVLALMTGTHGAYRSADLGEHWVAANDGLPTATSLLALAAGAGHALVSTTDGRVFRSDDGGQHWAVVGDGSVGRIDNLAFGSGRFYAGTFEGEVYVSDDAGESWSRTASDLPEETFLLRLIANASGLFACTPQALYRTSDHGATWVHLPVGTPGKPNTNDVATHQGALFAATLERGVQRSADGGATWTRVQATGGGPDPAADPFHP